MKYTITVDNRPDCCEVGAYGLHFAYGKAETDSDRAAAWFREHEGYTVTENPPAKTEKPESKGKKSD